MPGSIPNQPIAFVLPDMRYGGAESIALRLIRSLVEKGHTVDLVLMRKEGELLERLPPEVQVVDLEAARIRGALVPLIRYFRTRRPRAAQVRMWPLTVVAILARLLSGVRTRLVVSDHAILSDHYRSSTTQAALRITMRLFYPLPDARVAVSEGAARDSARLSGLTPDRFTVIHNPVEFPPEIRSTPEAEAMWDGPGPRILTVGKLKEEKNQQLLVRAFARLPSNLNARLTIAGDGPLLRQLQSLSRDLGVEDRLRFPGYVADPWPLYATADLFALPSREESFGNVLVEALYAGLPIVSTRTTGAVEVLDGGRFGALVEAGDVEALAAAMEDTLATPPGRTAARDRAIELSGAGAVAAYHRLLLGSPEGTE